MATPGCRNNGTGSAWPQIMEDMTGTFRYECLIRLDGGLRVVKRHIGTDTIVQSYDLSGALSTAMALPVKGIDPVEPDDHYAIALGVDSQNRVHLAGNGHTDPQHYIVSAPGDITKWTIPAYAFASTGANRHTYNIFPGRLSDGTLLWFFDQQDGPTGTAGRDWLAFYLPPGPGLIWKKLLDNSTGTASGELIRTTAGVSGSANRCYVMGVAIDEKDVIHVSLIWRTGDKDGNTQQQPCYIKGTKIGVGSHLSWLTVDNKPQSMPITWETRNTAGGNFRGAVIGSAPPISRSFGSSLALDKRGYPHLIVQNGGTLQGPDAYQPDAGPAGAPMGNIPNMSTYLHLWWDGTWWRRESIPAEAIGAARGPTIHRVGDDLILLTSTGGRHRVTRGAGLGSSAFIGTEVITGIEANVDPVALQRRSQLSIMVPDGDVSQVFTYCGNCS